MFLICVGNLNVISSFSFVIWLNIWHGTLLQGEKGQDTLTLIKNQYGSFHTYFHGTKTIPHISGSTLFSSFLHTWYLRINFRLCQAFCLGDNIPVWPFSGNRAGVLEGARQTDPCLCFAVVSLTCTGQAEHFPLSPWVLIWGGIE